MQQFVLDDVCVNYGIGNVVILLWGITVFFLWEKAVDKKGETHNNE